MNIPFLDLHAAYLEVKNEIDSAIKRVLDSGYYILGEEVEAFENEFANYCESSYAIGVGNGLDAIHLALLAMGVGPGDEVIVPSNTYIATWLAVSQCGATPVPVEPIIDTYNIDPYKIEAAINSATRVILPVHLYGQPVDIDPILSIANKYSLRVLEDAAQAHGARYKGRRIGSHGDAVAWSFYPGKNLGAIGDGGAITTNNSDLAERLRLLRNYGSRIKYLHEIKGFNSRLDPIQAAVLRVKIRFLDEWNKRREIIAKYYLKGLEGSDLILPLVPGWAEPVWHLFVIRHKQRENLQKRLENAGISTLVHYPIPPHKQKAYQEIGLGKKKLPLATTIANEILSIPIGPHLELERVLFIIKVLMKNKIYSK